MNIPPPVDRAVTVQLPPQEAYELFTQHLRDWWPLASHSCSGETTAQVSFEPRIGGAVVESTVDGRRFEWGRLTEWSPPEAFAMTWHPAQPAEAATRLRVSFRAVAEGTEVRVAHDGWEARGAEGNAIRNEYHNGWPRVLKALVDAAIRRRTAS